MYLFKVFTKSLDNNFARFDWLPYFQKIHQGPVVRGPIITTPGLNFNPGLSFFSSKAFSRTIFSINFRVANHQIVDKKN